MNSITVRAHAKINLSLDVINKREDGYHNLKMVMQTIDLHDIVYIEKTKKDIIVDCDNVEIPKGEKNIAWKAAKSFFDFTGINDSAKIKITKNIPHAAGLAGGSADAAAVLKGLNRLYDKKLSKEELALIGVKIGADVPFCIHGGTMLAEGIGERLTRLNSLTKNSVVLVKPNISVSTAWVFNRLRIDQITKRPNTEELIYSINNNDIEKIAVNMSNVLESVTAREYEEIEKIKELLMENNAVNSIMSGSGPTVFGVFKDDEKANNAYQNIKNHFSEVFLCKMISSDEGDLKSE